jgi:hypothetical protein
MKINIYESVSMFRGILDWVTDDGRESGRVHKENRIHVENKSEFPRHRFVKYRSLKVGDYKADKKEVSEDERQPKE